MQLATGLAMTSRLREFVTYNVRLKIWRQTNEFSYVVGSQSGWVGKLTQNFLNPFDIPSRP